MPAWLAAILAKSPFGNAPKVQAILVVFVILFLLGVAKCAHGAELEFSGGVTTLRGPTSAMGLKVIWPGAVAGRADLSCGLLLVGASDWHSHNANQAIEHCQVLNHLGRFSIGVGVAHLQNADDYNSGSVNFSLTAQAHLWSDWWLGWQHFSNAGTSMPNYGRDMVLLTWRFR
jgi:hypothetical protein